RTYVNACKFSRRRKYLIFRDERRVCASIPIFLEAFEVNELDVRDQFKFVASQLKQFSLEL
ncbi:MAG: hypothetical protein AAB403_06155, partial [Planctomycetota bacterium]